MMQESPQAMEGCYKWIRGMAEPCGKPYLREQRKCIALPGIKGSSDPPLQALLPAL